MNYAMLKDWEERCVEELVVFGTPRDEARRIMKWSRSEAERKSREAEDDRQFLMDFRELGSKLLSEREDKSQQAIRDRYNKLISKENMKERFAPDLRVA